MNHARVLLHMCAVVGGNSSEMLSMQDSAWWAKHVSVTLSNRTVVSSDGRESLFMQGSAW